MEQTMPKRFHLLYSVRSDLLDQLGRHDEAAFEFERAASSTSNGHEQTILIDRARVSRSPIDEEVRCWLV
jgi:predicted RNA polymerase sigma factor